MNRLFLILGATVLAATAFLLGQFLPIRQEAEPEIVYVELEPQLIVERRIGFSCDYDIGDLIPCEAAKAQYELAVSVFVRKEKVHSWNVPFAVCDGTNNDSSTDSVLRSGYFCASGSSGGFSGKQDIVELNQGSVRAEIDWLCSINRESYDFEFPITFALGTKGMLELGDDRRVDWEFAETGTSSDQ